MECCYSEVLVPCRSGLIEWALGSYSLKGNYGTMVPSAYFLLLPGHEVNASLCLTVMLCGLMVRASGRVSQSNALTVLGPSL